jgi:cell division protein FtsI (penicillin-binding protein 3)
VTDQQNRRSTSSERRRSAPRGTTTGRPGTTSAAPRTGRPPRGARPAGPADGRRDPNAGAPRPTSAGKPRSIRGRRTRRPRSAVGNPRQRSRIAMVVMLGILAVATLKLVTVQVVDISGYAAKSEAQRTRTITLTAQRGTVTDRNGVELALTVEGRAVAARPALFTDDGQRKAVADILVAGVGNGLTQDQVMTKLTSGKTYVYLARDLMPAQADAIMDKITPLFDKEHQDAVVTERQDVREHPDSSASSAVVGNTDYDGNGLSGFEAKFDTKLAGKDGERVVDVDARHLIIPGSARDETDAVDGMDVALTIDADLQYTTMQMLSAWVDKSAAKSGCVVIMQVADAQVPAMACYEPGKTPRETGNKAVTDAIEPGSVNKVVTMAAALEKGLITPEQVFNVDGKIDIGDATIKDAWAHGPQNMTVTGILGKSSNVGTLMVAQRLGPDAFMDMARKLGQGVRTGIQLPAETSGYLPKQSTWSSSTFGNLPIGQGVSESLLQLAGMYQAIANNGVRITPTLVASTTVNGVTTPTPAGAQTVAMSPQTAKTLVQMLHGPIQGGDEYHRGTAPQAAITGYQVAGKTGTAQQVDEDTGEYSKTLITSTFAGIVPADNPKYVIAIMLDNPKGDSPAGTTSCAPLFHDVAAYAMRAADVPPSAEQAPIYDLYVDN